MILGVVSGILGIGKSWLDNHQKIEKAKVKAKIAKIEAEQKSIGTADEFAVKNMNNTWKDEFFVIIFSVPLIMAFIPDLQPYVKEGFEAIDDMPEWYKLVLLGIISTIFGLRWLIQPLIAIMMKKMGIGLDGDRKP